MIHSHAFAGHHGQSAKTRRANAAVTQQANTAPVNEGASPVAWGVVAVIFTVVVALQTALYSPGLGSPFEVVRDIVWRVKIEHERYYDRMLGTPCASQFELTYTGRYEYETPLPDYSEVRTLWETKQHGRARELCASGDLWLKWATGMFQLLRPTVESKPSDWPSKGAQYSLNTLRDEFGIDRWPPPISANGAVQTHLHKYLTRFPIDFTFESNAIEDSTLSWKDTENVLELSQNGLDYYKAVRPDQAIHADEAVDHLAAWHWIIADLLPKVPVWELTEPHIRHLHALVTRRTLKEMAGVYRRSGIVMTNAALIAPQHEEVPQLMAKLTLWLQSLKSHLGPAAGGRYRYASHVNEAEANLDAHHPITLAALFHLFFVTIHPFEDGNGRTARLLLNYILMSLSLPPINLKSEKGARADYMEVLSAFSTTQGAVEFVDLVRRESGIEMRYLVTGLSNAVKLSKTK